MARYRFSKLAEDDFDRILDCTRDRFGPAQEERIGRRIQDAARKLADNPRLGHAREDLAEEDGRRATAGRRDPGRTRRSAPT